jgi:hypothetical protein
VSCLRKLVVSRHTNSTTRNKFLAQTDGSRVLRSLIMLQSDLTLLRYDIVPSMTGSLLDVGRQHLVEGIR